MKIREEIEKAAIEYAKSDIKLNSEIEDIIEHFIAWAEYILKAIEEERETYKCNCE